MILPIVAYGDPVLRKKTKEIDEDYPGLKELIDNMFETMYDAPGVGLAAPQVGIPIRLFIVDSEQLLEKDENKENGSSEAMLKEEAVKQVFINPQIIEETGDPWDFEEGCLSIPGIREDVKRKSKVLIEYYDENFELHEKEFTGVTGRIIQHEYDHIEGILFTDHLKSLKRQLLKSKLKAISKGNVEVSYKMLFPGRKKRVS